MNDLKIKRGNRLSAISFGIIIFIIAGGSFTNEGSFMGGGIEFETPQYLNYAILIIFLYYNYKYWLINKSSIKRLVNAVRAKVKLSKGYVEYIKNKSSIDFSKKISLNNKILGKIWTEEDRYIPMYAKPVNTSTFVYNTKISGFKCLVTVPVFVKDKRNGKIETLKWFLKTDTIKQLNQHPYTVVELNLFAYFYFNLKSFLGYVFLQDAFSTEYYPYILSVIASGLIIYNYLIKVLL